MNLQIQDKHGFTLIEVLVSMFILIVALLGLLSLTTMVIKGNAFSKTMTMATTLVKDKLEDIKNKNYNDVSVGTEIDYANSTGEVLSSSTGAFYTRTCTVSGDTPAANMKSINVGVAWFWNGATRNVAASTIISH